MSGIGAACAAQFARDLALVWRAGALAPLGFFAGTTALVPLAAGGEDLLPLLARVGPPLLWIAAALAILMVLERLFQADLEDGGFDQMRLSPAPLEWLVAAKAAALWVGIGVPLALAGALCALTLQAPPPALPALALGLAVGSAGLIGAGLVGAAAAASVKRGGVLIALLVLPFFAPLVLFGAAAARAAAEGAGLGPTFLLLCGVSLIAVALGPIGAAAALRLQGD